MNKYIHGVWRKWTSIWGRSIPIAVYGHGKFTEILFKQLKDELFLVNIEAIIADTSHEEKIRDIPVVGIADFNFSRVGYVVVSVGKYDNSLFNRLTEFIPVEKLVSFEKTRYPLSIIDSDRFQDYIRQKWANWVQQLGQSVPVAIYGAGNHTRLLFDVLDDSLKLVNITAIIDDDPPCDRFQWIPVFQTDNFDFDSVEYIIISSNYSTEKMFLRLQEFTDSRKIKRFYQT